jgi:hypothetical protein
MRASYERCVTNRGWPVPDSIGVRAVPRRLGAHVRVLAAHRAVSRGIALVRGVSDLAYGVAPVALGLWPVLPNLVSLVTAPGGVA